MRKKKTKKELAKMSKSLRSYYNNRDKRLAEDKEKYFVSVIEPRNSRESDHIHEMDGAE